MRRVVVVAGTMLAAVGLAACGGAASPSLGAVKVVRPTPTATASCATHDAAGWMGCLVRSQPAFGRTPLSQVSMPGSLEAATDDLDPQSFDVNQGSQCSQYTPSMVTQGASVERWFSAQDESLGEQLSQGSRFLDFEVGYNDIPKPTIDWRVDDTLYSQQPLQDYLIDVATWARAHPHEVVIVDFAHICYGNAPASVRRDLWRDLARTTSLADPSTRGVSLADVTFDATAPGTPRLGSLTLDDVVHQGGGGHNVVLIVPSGAADRRLLTGPVHVHPYFAVPATSVALRGAGASDTAPVAFSPTGVAPTLTPAGSLAADRLIERRALAGRLPVGALAGRGLYVSPVAYDLLAPSAAQRRSLFAHIGGLVAWESGLGAAESAAIARAWGHRANVVAVDEVDRGGVVAAVIELNGGATHAH